MAGTEREKKAIRSREEVADLRQKIAFLARVFSGSYGIRLIPGAGWACSLGREAQEVLAEYLAGEGKRLEEMDPELFRPTHILYQEESLYEWPLPAILGVARHEVGHVKHSDFRVIFMGQRQAVAEGRLPTSWAELFNSVEDPWVNNLEIAGSEAVRHNMRALYEYSLGEVVEKVNSQPLVRQLGLNINHWWFTGEEIVTIKNSKVREVFGEIKGDVEAYFTGESAQANYRLLQEKIWPKIKELEEAGVKQEMMMRLMEGLAGRKFRGGATGGVLGKKKERRENKLDLLSRKKWSTIWTWRKWSRG